MNDVAHREHRDRTAPQVAVVVGDDPAIVDGALLAAVSTAGAHPWLVQAGPAGAQVGGHATPAWQVSGTDGVQGLVVLGDPAVVRTVRHDPAARRLVRDTVDAGMPVALLGAASTVLVDAGRARGRRVAAGAGERQVLTTAGAVCVDDRVARDVAVFTSPAGADPAPVLRAFLDDVLAHGAR